MRTGALLVPIFALACGASPPPERARESSANAPEPEPAASVEPAVDPEPIEPASPASPAMAEIPCATDTDCGWDDPCAPTRCVERRPLPPVDCEVEAASGACACLGGLCTVLPTGTSANAGGVVTGPPCTGYCSTDPSGGVCRPDDSSGVLPSGIIGPGAHCSCDPAGTPGAVCSYRIVPVVPCRDARDCDVSHEPDGPVPVRAARRRRRDFRPCDDGEWEPRCNDGHCIAVGFRC